MPVSPRRLGASVRGSPDRPKRPVPASAPEGQPFLKWAGGKAQLLEQFKPHFPGMLESYCEPFVGGGAVFFHLRARFPKMRVKLFDNNAELINCYAVVRDQVE